MKIEREKRGYLCIDVIIQRSQSPHSSAAGERLKHKIVGTDQDE